jgi:hypothetical protein
MKYLFLILVSFGIISCLEKQENSIETSNPQIPDSINSDLANLLDVKSQEELKPKKKLKPIIKYRIDLDKIDTFECNLEVVLHVEMNLDSLYTQDIDALLKTMDSSCSNNVEFSEISNMVLFETIENYPVETLELLLSNNYSYDFEYIYSVLSYSLGDLPQVEEIEKRIIEKNLKGTRVDSVINALKIAVETY